MSTNTDPPSYREEDGKVTNGGRQFMHIRKLKGNNYPSLLTHGIATEKPNYRHGYETAILAGRGLDSWGTFPVGKLG